MRSSLAQQILLLSSVFFGKLQSSITPNAVECKFNEKACSPSYCILSKGRGKFKYLNAGCNLIEPVTSAMLYVEFLRKTKAGIYLSTNLKTKTDICKLIDLKSGSGIMSNLMSLSMNSLGNLKCPLKGNITISRMPLLTFVIQGFLADGDYKIYVQVVSKALQILNMNLSITATS